MGFWWARHLCAPPIRVPNWRVYSPIDASVNHDHIAVRLEPVEGHIRVGTGLRQAQPERESVIVMIFGKLNRVVYQVRRKLQASALAAEQAAEHAADDRSPNLAADGAGRGFRHRLGSTFATAAAA